MDQRPKSQGLDHLHHFLVWVFLRENRAGAYYCHQYISPSWLLHLTWYFDPDPQPVLFPDILCLLFSSCFLLSSTEQLMSPNVGIASCTAEHPLMYS